MPDKPKNIAPSNGGVFQNFTDRIRLIMRLMADSRVNPIVKLLPLGTMLYFIMFPDLAPGPVDDALLLWLGSTVFVELCPAEVVAEHEEAIRKILTGEWKDANPDDVIDSDARDIK